MSNWSATKARRVLAALEAEKHKQQEFFGLAERFRSATDPEEVKRLGDQMGRMVFGNDGKNRDVGQSTVRRPPAPDRPNECDRCSSF
jgi:hypothetical protein